MGLLETALFEEDLNQLQETMERLRRDSNAITGLLVDRDGQQIVAVGHEPQFELSSLATGNFDPASLSQEREFSVLFHEGERTNFHISIISNRALLLILFDEHSSLGLVRLRVRRLGGELGKIIETIVEKAAAEDFSKSILGEITSEDLANLFGQ